MSLSRDLDRAIRFAATAHRHQVRKGSGVPYISHPFAVAMILQQHGCPESWIIAGLLHDTVEDTAVTLDDIRREFGDEVAAIVEGCSEPEHTTRPWEHRKRHTLETLAMAPLAVRVVTCADKIHNLQSILVDAETQGESVWTRFKKDRKRQEWYYRGLAATIRKNLPPDQQHVLFDELARLVDEVFGPG